MLQLRTIKRQDKIQKFTQCTQILYKYDTVQIAWGGVVVNLFGTHTLQNLEQAWMQQAVRGFPQLNFKIHVHSEPI